MDGKHFEVRKMVPGENAPPMHPNCRCNIAPWEAVQSNTINPQGLRAGNVGGSGDVPDHRPPVILEKIDAADKSMIESTLRKYEKEIYNSPIENAIVICRDGTVVHCFGTLNGVYPDADLGEKLRGAYVTHNHPKGSDNEYLFSKQDYRIFCEYELQYLAGIDEKYIYELSRKEKAVDTPPTISEATPDDTRHVSIIRNALSDGYGYTRKRRN